jgi:hypothetical protein
MPVRLGSQGVPNLFADSANVAKVEIPVWLTRRSNADKGKICLVDRRSWILGGAQAASTDGFRDNLIDLGFYDW